MIFLLNAASLAEMQQITILKIFGLTGLELEPTVRLFSTIEKPKKIFGSKESKGPKHDSLKLLRLPMSGGE